MSSTAADTGDAPGATPRTGEGDTLEGLRREIDAIDDALHDLLMRRADVVERVGRLRKTAFRPGREARIIRRLLGRHRGPLPRRALARLWREVFAAHIAIETPFTISVCDTAEGAPLAAAAREHFGVLTPLRVHRSPAQALADVSRGAATAGVLPLPVEEEPAQAAWWTALLHQDGPRLFVVARLPFWASPRGEGTIGVQALVVAASFPDPSGQDRALLGLEVPAEMSRARLAAALAQAGIEAGGILLRRDAQGGPARGLIDLAGALAEADPRLPALERAGLRPVALGGYALPVEDAPA